MVEIVTGRCDPAAVDRLLRAMPDWFGIEQSILDYVRDAQTRPTYLALGESGEVVGAMLITRHNAASAEIHLMAVSPEHHRQGIGRALVGRVGEDLRTEGVRLLEVKTLGPSLPDEHYAGTRAFYESVGFMPLEEIEGLWPGNPCLILVKPLAM